VGARPSGIGVVLPGDEKYNLARARRAFAVDDAVRLVTTENPMKRNALRVGIQEATNPVVVLSDSDTFWEPDLLENQLMPLADPEVGGAGTRQRFFRPQTSVWR